MTRRIDCPLGCAVRLMPASMRFHVIRAHEMTRAEADVALGGRPKPPAEIRAMTESPAAEEEMMKGRALKEKRNELGLSARELAEQIGVNPGTVYNWESNKCAPTGENLKRLLEVLDEETYAAGTDGDAPTWECLQCGDELDDAAETVYGNYPEDGEAFCSEECLTDYYLEATAACEPEDDDPEEAEEPEPEPEPDSEPDPEEEATGSPEPPPQEPILFCRLSRADKIAELSHRILQLEVERQKAERELAELLCQAHPDAVPADGDPDESGDKEG